MSTYTVQWSVEKYINYKMQLFRILFQFSPYVYPHNTFNGKFIFTFFVLSYTDIANLNKYVKTA